jgi:DNA-binding NarL/FixJ family response regulator
MEAFADRARRELLAGGGRVRRRTVDTCDELTPHEVQIDRLARDGLSNPEIGARLFLGPRTVERHLRKVFSKAGGFVSQGAPGGVAHDKQGAMSE